MYYIEKTIEISAAHKLNLPYESKCNELHGHNYIITVYCKSGKLNENGMVIDFAEIKRIVGGQLDHTILGLGIGKNSTAENIAHWVYCRVAHCYKVRVQESSGNVAIYSYEEE